MKDRLLALVISISAIASCDAPSEDDNWIPDSWMLKEAEQEIGSILGCYRESGGLEFELTRRSLISGDVEYSVGGYIQIKSRKFLKTDQTLMFDRASNSIKVRRELPYNMHVIEDARVTTITVFDKDRIGVPFRRVECDKEDQPQASVEEAAPQS